MVDNKEELEYTYHNLVEGKEYKQGDGFRVGPNPNAPDWEFCIEDSIGRFIPLRWEDIGDLQLMLDEISLNFNKKDLSYKNNLDNGEYNND